jgi:DNA-binding LytR/AlgR family response regulator
MIKCLVVDDEPNATELIEAYVAATPSLELVASCNQSKKALEILKTHPVDVLFLDIRMPEMNGFELLQELKNPPQVIIITAHVEYAIFGYQFDVLDYLLKPLSLEDFQKSVSKIKLKKTDKEPDKLGDSFYIREEYKLIKIRVKDILFVESYREYVHLHTLKKKYVFRKTLSNVEKRLSTKSFLRVHKSYIVSLDAIEAVEGNRMQIDKHHIPIGKSYKEAFYKRLDLI